MSKECITFGKFFSSSLFLFYFNSDKENSFCNIFLTSQVLINLDCLKNNLRINE